MGYSGGRLSSLCDPRPVELALYRIAERGGDRLVEWTVRNTPIRHGNLRSSWYQIPVTTARVGPFTGYESGVASESAYAPHVEYGTGLWGPSGAKYAIEPKTPGGTLHWRDRKTGTDVFAKRVLHPGSPGAHMVAIAATMVEAEFDHLFDDILAEWARAYD